MHLLVDLSWNNIWQGLNGSFNGYKLDSLGLNCRFANFSARFSDLNSWQTSYLQLHDMRVRLNILLSRQSDHSRLDLLHIRLVELLS